MTRLIKVVIVIMALCSAVPVNALDRNTYRSDTFCLAQNIYFEAGNQPLVGKLAVAWVTVNRMDHELFPDTVCEVVYQARTRKNSKGEDVPILHKCQFSWYCDGKPDLPQDSQTWIIAVEIAQQMLNNRGVDITEGALWYHADYIKPPYWAYDLMRVVTIENHIFYK